MVHRRKSKAGSRVITPSSEPQVEDITFECSLPTEVPALERLTKPLPFSKNITENLAWAAAFIDRAGHLTQDYEILEKRLHAAIDTIGNDAIEMTLLRQQLHAQSHKVAQLEAAVAGAEKVNQDLEQRLEESRAAALKTEQELAQKLRITEKALSQSKAAEKRLKNKLDKTLLEEHERWLQEVQHEKEDHASIDAAHDALERALQEKAALQAELDSKSQELISTKHELEVAREQLVACKENCQSKEAEIRALTEQLATANRTNTELSGSLDTANAQLAAKEQELADANTTLGDVNKALSDATQQLTEANEKITQKDTAISTLEANLATVNEDRDQKSKLLEDLQKSNEETQTALQAKIDELSAHDLEDHQRLQAAEEAKRLSEESVRELQARVEAANAHDAETQARLAAEEEAKRLADAELERVKIQLEEAKKPKLPNKVTLADPIPIIGSLGGAADNYDDKFYPIVCSFPVTIYGHSSTQVFVNINGTLTLDVGDASYGYQPLPFRNGSLPQYTLLPFWCDLYIYKDTPQGIYYEISGQAPTRTLCVEWYVSRYRDPNQYYHFNVTLEEARPNIAVYKYFEALDKGGACTIGAQGPDSAQMWSHNQQKALPGVQVVIDTSSGTISESTFQVPS